MFINIGSLKKKKNYPPLDVKNLILYITIYKFIRYIIIYTNIKYAVQMIIINIIIFQDLLSKLSKQLSCVLKTFYSEFYFIYILYQALIFNIIYIIDI